MKFNNKSSDSPPYNLYLWSRFMKIILIFFILGIMQADAATYGQKITLNQDEVSIKEIFKLIKKQTGYDVIWQSNSLNLSQKINAHFNNIPIRDVVLKCITPGNQTVEISDKSIIIRNVLTLKQDSVVYRGKVTDENGRIMVGATIKVIGGNRSTFTTSKGLFAIYGPRKGTLEITYIGYLNRQITLNNLNYLEPIDVKMIPGNNNLGEVSVVSTGYQDIAKERATGSFEVITKEQLEHSSDPNLVKRLEGITTSMNFNNQLNSVNSASTTIASTDPSKSPLANLTIRGKNTLNTNQVTYLSQSGEVLVVIDGVASPYSIDNVNPNDVESITVLKDAAAASIWGSRAANGVIVVKTKRGNYDKPVNVFFNSNFNLTEKPDLFYKKVMSTSDYIDAQVFLFNASKTKVNPPTIGIQQPFLSPVAEILGRQQNGQISSAQANSEIDALRGNDVRRDFEKYILRDAFTQSYSLAIDGGSKRVAYRISGGYDNTQENSIGAGSNRLALSYNSSYKPLKNLELSIGVTYSVRNTENQATEQAVSANVAGNFYPYTQLVDSHSNAISIPYKYRPAFIDLLSSNYGNKIQDLTFTPLKNIKEGYYKTSYKNLNFNLGANYRINNFLSVNVLYNYSIDNNQQNIYNSQNSFYMRDLVSYYTSPSGVQAIPLGGLYRPTTIDDRSHSLRGQLNVNQKWGEKHAINLIAGSEVTQSYFLSKSFQYYGYNKDNLFSTNQLDFKDYVPLLFDNGFGATAQIPYNSTAFTDGRIRTYSLYSNGAYTYNGRYTISGSIRKDQSSVFGVGTNKGGAPFFSVGAKWNIAAENFYKLDFLPILQLRSTFGYNGNVNPLVSARQLISYSGGTQVNGLLYATTGSDATNDLLRPEKTGVLNLGLDFGVKNGRVSGSFEYYNKRTKDLIAPNSIDPSTGFNRLSFNTATLQGWGTDFSISTINFRINKFSWTSNFLFSYNRVKVAKIFTAAAKTAADVISGTPAYNEGADLSRLYAYRWAGLDPVTGSPVGYFNGQPMIVNSTASYLSVTGQPMSTAHYFGSAVPVYFGSLRNTFRYGALSVSANILYKLGYYFRRPQSDLVRYSQLFSSNVVQGSEYSNRWQKPGDELFTNVPSQIYPANNLRDLFYQFSEINVLKADHIRLQEINISYSLSKKNWFLKNPRVYANISNLGIIWRANKLNIDPDIGDYPNPRTYAFGFSANF